MSVASYLALYDSASVFWIERLLSSCILNSIFIWFLCRIWLFSCLNSVPGLKAAAAFSSAVPRSPTRRLVGVRVVPQRDADCKDDGCVILCDKQALFLAVEADAEGCQFSPCSSAGATNALVKSARQLSRRHESRWELPVTPRTHDLFK